MPSRLAAKPYRLAFAVIPRFNMMALTSTIEPLRVANYLAASALYEWRFVSEVGGRIVASNGLDVPTVAAKEHHDRIDLAIACASWGAEHDRSRALHRWLRRVRGQGARLAAIDLGIYLLACAGLLEGRRVTAHHSWLSGFAETFSNVETIEQLYTADDAVTTMAGSSTGLDVMLKLVASQHGDRLATEVADQILHHRVREATEPQRRGIGGPKGDTHPVVKAAVELMLSRIAEPLAMPEIALAVGASHRQLERLFHQHLGCSAVRVNALLRLQHARALLTGTVLSIREVSVASGFNSLSYFSQTFTRTFGKRPSDYRETWPKNEEAPAWPGTVFDYLERMRKEPDARTRRDRTVTRGSSSRRR